MRSLVLMLALLAAGCADKTAILVEVSSADLAVPSDVDALRFVAVSDGGHRVDETYALSGTWPHSLALLPAGSGDSSVTITVSGMQAGVARVRRVVEASFSRGSTRRVVVTLARDCFDRGCPEGVDCVGGMCVGQMSDGGVDAGSDDGGPGDAGSSDDAGPMDGGGIDAGPMDGGGIDGGVDSGARDSGPIDSGPIDGGPIDSGPRDSGPIDGGPIDGGPPDAGPGEPPRLLFSEYVEGDGSNKALEIVNLGTTTVNLSACSIRRYANGTTTPTPAALSGTLAPGAVLAVCNGMLDMATTRCGLTTGVISHNGDDAYDLACDGVVLDTFGQIGVDPGTEWTGGGLSTLDFVLTRRCTVTAGDTNGADAFDPSVEWQGSAWVSAASSLGGLGNRSECP